MSTRSLARPDGVRDPGRDSGSGTGPGSRPRLRETPPPLDAVSKKIIEQLQEDGRPARRIRRPAVLLQLLADRLRNRVQRRRCLPEAGPRAGTRPTPTVTAGVADAVGASERSGGHPAMMTSKRATTQANPLSGPAGTTKSVGSAPRNGRRRVHNQRMSRYGAMYGPDVTFTGVPRCDLSDPASYADASAVIVGAPYDSGTSYRSGARMGPMALRICDYSEHTGSRPHLSLRVDPLLDLGVVDAGDVEMAPTETERALQNLQDVITQLAAAGKIPVVLGGDHTIALADVTGLAEHFGYGRISVVHFDAHADTGDIQFGSLYGHGLPMRRVIESGAVRGDRFLQIGLRGYWPEPPELLWMAERGMRGYEMAEIQ